MITSPKPKHTADNCRSLSKVQCVSVEASLSAFAHSYEGADAANLLKGRSHIGDLHVGGNTDRLRTDLTLKANKFCNQQLATTAA